VPEITGRPAYHPALMLKIYVYGYLNRIQSSRRLERETQRNIEPMWLTGQLMPDFKTIADFRRDSGPARARAFYRSSPRRKPPATPSAASSPWRTLSTTPRTIATPVPPESI
jgi:Transposase domain (DUF772)